MSINPRGSEHQESQASMHTMTKMIGKHGTASSHRCIITNAAATDTSPRPRADECNDTMEVTITVISLAGVVAKKYESKKSTMLPTQRKKNRHPTPTNAATTSLVASFCQAFTSNDDGTGTPLTHVPSNPIEQIDATRMSSKSKPTPQPIVHWPGMKHDDDGDANQVLSTLRFSRRFEREDVASSQGRFIPQTCPIRVSLSRHGHLINMGKANVIITGEEKGVSSMIVPVSSTIKKVASRHKSSIPMIKIKGDDLMLGLSSDAMLRVLVSVSKVQTEEKEVLEISNSICVDLHSHPASDDNIAVIVEPPSDDRQKVVCDNAMTESGSKGKDQVNSRKETQLAEEINEENKTARPRRMRQKSTTVMGGSLFGEELDRQEKPDAVDPQDIRTVEAQDDMPDFLALEGTATSLNVAVPYQTGVENSRDVDTTLSLCVLGAILGSSAPSCVKKNGRKTANASYWGLEDGVDVEDIPDLDVDNLSYMEADTDLSDKEGFGLNDTFTTASLSDDESEGASLSNEDLIDFDVEGLDIVPDINNVDQSDGYHSPAFDDEPSIKKAADSALAWSALALILNSPAPAAVSKSGSSCASKHLFEDDESLSLGELDNALFTIQEVEEEASFYDASIDDMPSLADTDESPPSPSPCSPQRKQREYKFKDSLDDNDLLSQIETMANRIEQCRYCKLLYCQEFPCSMRSMKGVQ